MSHDLQSTIRPTVTADLPALRGLIEATELFPGEMLEDMAAAFWPARSAG